MYFPLYALQRGKLEEDCKCEAKEKSFRAIKMRGFQGKRFSPFGEDGRMRTVSRPTSYPNGAYLPPCQRTYRFDTLHPLEQIQSLMGWTASSQVFVASSHEFSLHFHVYIYTCYSTVSLQHFTHHVTCHRQRKLQTTCHLSDVRHELLPVQIIVLNVRVISNVTTNVARMLGPQQTFVSGDDDSKLNTKGPPK